MKKVFDFNALFNFFSHPAKTMCSLTAMKTNSERTVVAKIISTLVLSPAKNGLN